jgi:WhiB family redox-sensing transcriptional regulator
MRMTTDTRLPDLDQTDDWRDQAACIEHAQSVEFFPARGESTREAKAVCQTCAVRRECLEYALQWDHLCGVWGGMSERERRQVRRRNRTRAL